MLTKEPGHVPGFWDTAAKKIKVCSPEVYFPGGKDTQALCVLKESKSKEGPRREKQHMKCLAQYVASAHAPIILVPMVGNAEHQHTDMLENNWTTWYVR